MSEAIAQEVRAGWDEEELLLRRLPSPYATLAAAMLQNAAQTIQEFVRRGENYTGEAYEWDRLRMATRECVAWVCDPEDRPDAMTFVACVTGLGGDPVRIRNVILAGFTPALGALLAPTSSHSSWRPNLHCSA